MLTQQDSDTALLEHMRKITERLYMLERKMDVLADLLRPKTPEIKSAEPKVVSKPLNPMDFYAQEGKQHQRNVQPNAQRTHQNYSQHNHSPKEGPMYSAVCADCRKECSIPFKPTGERPVYCKDCFSRRKNPNMFKAKEEENPQAVSLVQPVAVSEVQPAAVSDRQKVKTKKSKKSGAAAKTKKKPVKAKKASSKKSPTKKSKRR